jgi:hypothetical protein
LRCYGTWSKHRCAAALLAVALTLCVVASISAAASISIERR